MEISGSDLKDPLRKELVIRAGELEITKALELACVLEGENLVNLPSKLVNFSNYVGMLVVEFEKEINCLMKKLEARKGCGVKVSSGRRKHLSASCFEGELQT